MQDGDLAATIALPAMPGWKLIATGDFNGDATTDLIWRRRTGSLGDWLMRQRPAHGHLRASDLKAIALWRPRDFNGDGKSPK